MNKIIFTLACVFTALAINAQQLQKGYHGFADVGYCICNSQLKPSVVEVTTSHGYQFNPYLFLGAGVGFIFNGEAKWGEVGGHPYNKRDSKVDIPIFFNARANFMKTKFCPFVDGKVGAHVNNGNGIYVTATLGCRYAINENMGISLSVGYEVRKATVDQLVMIPGGKYNGYKSTFYYKDRKNEPLEGVIIKAGFDF